MITPIFTHPPPRSFPQSAQEPIESPLTYKANTPNHSTRGSPTPPTI